MSSDDDLPALISPSADELVQAANRAARAITPERVIFTKGSDGKRHRYTMQRYAIMSQATAEGAARAEAALEATVATWNVNEETQAYCRSTRKTHTYTDETTGVEYCHHVMWGSMTNLPSGGFRWAME